VIYLNRVKYVFDLLLVKIKISHSSKI